MGWSILLVTVGLTLLIGGGDMLVRGSVALAQRLGISSIVIGLTVVAFGTSTPELVVNLSAALEGRSAIGFGNVVGSNIANIGLLLGITALYRPLMVHATIVVREIPMMILACAAAVALGLDQWWDGQANMLTRGDGMVLLLLFAVFLYYTIADALRQRGEDLYISESNELIEPRVPRAGWLMPALIVGGLVLLIVGGQLMVRGAVGLATGLGVPEVVVGLTVVAVGTSLPELATSVIAARRGHSDVAIGNIVGSNLYNLLFILGVTHTLAPAELPAGAGVDLWVMTGFAAVLLPLVMTHQRKLTRAEGAVLLMLYAGYVVWLAARG